MVIIFYQLKGRHTSLNIKRQYDDLIKEFEIEPYKIVADQAANMKKAFLEVKEGDKNVDNDVEEDFFLMTANTLLINQRRQDLAALKEKLEKEAIEKLEKEINEMNKPTQTKITDFSCFTREQVYIYSMIFFSSALLYIT